MAVPLDKLIAWRDSLVESRLGGVREVTDQNGERVRYATDAEMARAIAAAESMIAATQKPRPGMLRVSTSKGI